MSSNQETTSIVCHDGGCPDCSNPKVNRFVAARLPRFSKYNDVEHEIDLINARDALPEVFMFGSSLAGNNVSDTTGDTSDMVDVAAVLCLNEDSDVVDDQNEDKEDDWIMLLPQD